MDKEVRQQLGPVSDQVAEWISKANAILRRRSKVQNAAKEAVTALRGKAVEIQMEGSAGWRVIPLTAGDTQHLENMSRQSCLITLDPIERDVLSSLTTDVAVALDNAKTILGIRRFLSGGRKREAGEGAAGFLIQYHHWALSTHLPHLLDRLSHGDKAQHVPLTAAFENWVGLQNQLPDFGNVHALLPIGTVAHLPRSVQTINGALQQEEHFRTDAIAAGELVRKQEVVRLLADMPVERLKDATRDRLLITPLMEAGVHTVEAVLNRGASLSTLAGIGATSANRMRGAAQTLWHTIYEETPVRIDISNRTGASTELLRCLTSWGSVRQIKRAATDLALKDSLAPLARALDDQVEQIAVFAHERTITELIEGVARVTYRAQQLPENTLSPHTTDPWEEFFRRPADYFSMLSELGFITEDEQKTHGDLPDDIVEAVRMIELDTQELTASLRGYQSFGARFALAQRKVIIGDEMGLGKTVEALAVLAHLRSKGSHYSVVVCPAAVVTNWIREIRAKSNLQPHRLHGPGREAASRSWIRSGGVAVTTFEMLRWTEHRMLGLSDPIGCIVVDEAHYIKNPSAQRSQRAAGMIQSAHRAILLTGTPLENRIDEFKNLVGYVRPDLMVDADDLSPRLFRRQVAPAYLRRNQEDVLTELPELVEVDEWLPFSREDAARYADSVAAGNFMAMRRAALHDGKSEKMHRLIEIVQEAEDNGRRVIVFSQFRDVLDRVAQALPGRVFGPLTGSVPAAARQVLVDQFSVAAHGAVLVSQIVAGGVGLNIQAASVVVICEPQLKPTTEWQAIARARRMGQLETVQVHRLLSEEGVDRRITAILERKQEIFGNFARVSDIADSAPEAFDLSEAELARDIVAAERERLFAQRTNPTMLTDEVCPTDDDDAGHRNQPPSIG